MSWKRPPARKAKQFEGDIAPRQSAPSIGLAAALRNSPPMAQPHKSRGMPDPDELRGRKNRESARDEDCDVRIPGVCNFDSKTTVWSHFPGLAGGRGMGYKSLDLCGVYACSSCHDVVDDRAPAPDGETRQSIMLAWHEGHLRSLLKLRSKGLV